MIKKISEKHSNSDWTSDLSDINSDSWTKGIEIVRTRFESRYFLPIEQLINSSDKVVKYNCGFLIMSIDSLLIETLNQFYLGLYNSDEKYSNKNKDKTYTDKENKFAFRDFFKHSSFFPDFKADEKVIFTFYREIRCGLLHQAESKTNSLINIRGSKMVTLIDNSNPEQGLIINRKLFHNALVDEFNKYLKDLEDPTSKNIFGENLREKCNRKMQDLCK